MKQVLQSLKNGEITLAEVPCPMVRKGHILVQSTRSLISAGTERMLLEFGRSSMLQKARSQPEKVKQVVNKVKTEGLVPTLESVFRKLDEPLALGYCHAGRVIDVGAGVAGFRVGDRVVTNGSHAEVVCVPQTLAALIPDSVSDEAACFAPIGSIALQGIRLLEPTFGERFVVVGLGLIGLVAVQLLRSHGCEVLGLDTNPRRCDLARSFGVRAETIGQDADSLKLASEFSNGVGVDGVLITASAKTDEIIHQAAESCRKRGRVVLVGVVGLNLRRSDFYEKELSFHVSCSYGPGRYDPDYERNATDYPLAFVRWTAGRNLEAVVGAMERGQLKTDDLVTHRIRHQEAQTAYSQLLGDDAALGIVLEYANTEPPTATTVAVPSGRKALPLRAGGSGVGVIGSGNFARSVLLPALKKSKVAIRSIASAGGVSGLHAAQSYGAAHATTDFRTILADDEVGSVFITTRHDMHVSMAVEALDAGKHVFVEKPMAIDDAGLATLREAKARHPDLCLTVGFNRRFAPFSVQLRESLAQRAGPLAASITVNAGALPVDHWLLDASVGGGRIVGEACHFFDLLRYFVGMPIVTVQSVPVADTAHGLNGSTTTLQFEDGSVGVVHYWVNGSKAYPKELVEAFWDGRVVRIDNWRKMTGFGVSRSGRSRMDKGHAAGINAFVDAVRGAGPSPIGFDEIVNVTEATFAAVKAARQGVAVRL